MHLETLKVFCDVVETKSFSAAASQNFVTQSAVSQQVRMLEERWGRRLLERTRGNVRLTPAGDILYQASKDIVQRFQEMEGQLQASANVVSGTVRVATGIPSVCTSCRHRSRYLKAFPGPAPLEYSRSSKISRRRRARPIDLGSWLPTRRPGITVISFRQDRLVLVTPPGHPLARHRTVAVRKLAGEPLVGFERDIPTRKETDRLLRKHGVEVRYIMELDNVETIKQVVEIGHGVAILPEPAIRPEVKQKSLAVVQLADEVLFRPLGIIHRQGKHFSPAAEKFIEYLRAE